MGSSPLARGLPVIIDPSRGVLRIIPARAGFTRVASWAPEYASDHPRSRGVYTVTIITLTASAGSSPLARGLLNHLNISMNVFRIIPARAGFTVVCEGSRSWLQDHPRSRGVYTSIVLSVSGWSGSSPLARGLLCRDLHLNPHVWIIPARAGFTTAFLPLLREMMDHPRSRGVYKAPVTMMVTGAGSSPLARGLLKKLKIYSPRQRIIPARAGFTPLPCTKDMVGADHPRSRGVYNISLSLFLLRIGSSPLARGLQKGCHHEILIPGIIPARAGFTQ